MSTHAPRTAPILLGLGGLKASGKDAVADILAISSPHIVKMGMSDVLADALYTLNPLIPGVSFPERDTMRYADHVDVVGYTQAKTHPEVRRLLQSLGTEVGRDLLSPTLWVDALRLRIEHAMAKGSSVVLTGIRYPNELWLVRALNGVSVYVTRPSLTESKQESTPDLTFRQYPSVLPADLDSHTSETSVGPDDFDARLANDGTLADLRTKTLLLLETVLTVRTLKPPVDRRRAERRTGDRRSS